MRLFPPYHGSISLSLLLTCLLHPVLGEETLHKDLPTPADKTAMTADIWIEGEHPAAQNMTSVRGEDSCWGGRFLFLNEAELPASQRFFARYTFTVEKPGTYLFYGAIQRQQVNWTSPTGFAMNGGTFALLTDTGAKASWGLSRAVTWVRLGEFRLESGEHRLEFEIKDKRELGKNYAFMIDAVAAFRLDDTPGTKP